jgi:16S rRNA (cytidine1402-2'-O)-methyltransferase
VSGQLILIPCQISEDGLQYLPSNIGTTLKTTNYFIVERLRTARRFMKSVDQSIDIDSLTFLELDKNNPNKGLDTFLQYLKKGENIGLLSEAGCPAIADPGHLAVKWCHSNNIKVHPLVGPSSILLALMSSGFNGQNFAFNGYLPNKANELSKKLKHLETLMQREEQTQLFMDAPYRNEFLLKNCISALNKSTLLCIACDLNSNSETIICKSISEWSKSNTKQFHKRPAIFIIGK